MAQDRRIGCRTFGKIHLRLLKEIPAYELVGFYDPDDQAGRTGSRLSSITQISQCGMIWIDAVDAVDILLHLLLSHFDCA